MRVLLPWPPRELSPNARVHWAKKAKIAKAYRVQAFVLAIEVCGLTLWRASASVSITFNPPDNRARDLDNMLASMKSALDGIASAIGVDDSKWTISIRKGEVVMGGQVVVEVTE